MGIETIYWHTLHPRYLNSNSRVLDLGANLGRFSRAVIQRFGCTCHAVEPSPAEYERIPESTNIQKHNLAITSENGRADFHINASSTASSLGAAGPAHVKTISVLTRRLDEFVHHLGWDTIDLIKLDIEGAEIAVIDSLSDDFLKNVRQFSIEFHDFCGITPQADVKRVLRRLVKLGFYAVKMSRVGHQDTWLINIDLCPISRIELLFSKLVIRNWFGLRRVLSRLISRAK